MCSDLICFSFHCLGYNFTRKSREDEEIVLTYHRIIEAFKFGFAGRAKLGDPNFDTQTGNDTYDSIKEVSTDNREIGDAMAHALLFLLADFSL